jgi:hypothetical protein
MLNDKRETINEALVNSNSAFSVQPLALGGRLYKTGDLARYRADGNIEYLGRIDHQVKLRGFRIELGEIEAALARQPAVREAVVIAREDVPGDKRLVAYIVLRIEDRGSKIEDSGADGDDTLSSTLYPLSSIQKELRSYLREQLPVYMVPAAFVVLDALPRTPNGKLDRGALPVPDSRRSEHDGDFVAPRSAAETILADIWCEALRLAQVSVHDNFFDLGGHSLSGTQIVSRIRQAFQLTLTVRQLFACPTVAALAGYMAATEIQPGRTDAIARALLRIKGMSTADKQQILQRRTGR